MIDEVPILFSSLLRGYSFCQLSPLCLADTIPYLGRLSHTINGLTLVVISDIFSVKDHVANGAMNGNLMRP